MTSSQKIQKAKCQNLHQSPGEEAESAGGKFRTPDPREKQKIMHREVRKSMAFSTHTFDSRKSQILQEIEFPAVAGCDITTLAISTIRGELFLKIRNSEGDISEGGM